MINQNARENRTLKEVHYSIGYIGGTLIPIQPSDVVDCQINWSLGEYFVDGYCVFQDKMGVFENIPHTSVMAFRIYATDAFGTSAEHYFYVSKIHEHKSNTSHSKDSFRIEFVDFLYWWMINSYNGEGFSSKTISQVIKHFVDTKIPSDNTFQKYLPAVNVVPSSKVYESIVVPIHKPFLNFLANREVIDSLVFSHSRIGVNIFPLEKWDAQIVKMFNGDNGAVFKLIDPEMPSDITNPFLIYSIKVISQDAVYNNISMPAVETIYLNRANKQVVKEKISQDSVMKEFKITNEILTIGALTGGLRQIETPENPSKMVKNIYFKKLKQNLLVEIETTGSFVWNLMFNVKLDLASSLYVQNTNIKNKTFSGEYTIIKIVDKFQGSLFSQYITLGRSGISKN